MSKCRGFTLIELLVVIAILAILISSAVSYFSARQPQNQPARANNPAVSNSAGQFYPQEAKKQEDVRLLLQRIQGGEFKTAGEIRAAWSAFLERWSTNPEERTLAMSISDEKVKDEFVAYLHRMAPAEKAP